MNYDIQKSNQLFKKMLDSYGPDSAEALHWKNAKSQRLRYDLFSTLGDFNNSSVLDVGSGLGDFYGYLREKDYNQLDYLGVEVLPDYVENARRKFPSANFVQGDLFHYEPPKRFDYVICCGALNVNIADMEKLVRKAILKLYSHCNVAVGFNLLSENAVNKEPTLYNYNPLKILKFCFEITPFVRYMHDYLDNDFTIFMYKRQRFAV